MANILITGLGCPGAQGTITSLQYSFKLFGCDARDKVPLSPSLSEFETVPRGDDPAYVDAIRALCKRWDINLIVPQTTLEAEALSAYSGIKGIPKLDGIPMLVSRGPFFRVANSKWHAIRVAESIDVPVPETHLVSTRDEFEAALKAIGKQVIVKKPVGFGSRGFWIVEKARTWDEIFEGKGSNKIDIFSLISVFPEKFPRPLVVQEYLPGTEYTVDTFRSMPPGTTVSIPRRRVTVKGGISWGAKVEMRPDLIEHSNKLADAMGLIYCFGFQFKEDAEGVPRLIECNPRIQGGMIVSTLAGFNMIKASANMALGMKWDPPGYIREVRAERYSAFVEV